MVMIILIICIIGISAGGFSNNISFFLVARIIQGIGISMFLIVFGIIKDQLPVQKLATGVGIFSSMFAAGSVVGLAIGGSIIQNFGWHTTFLSIVPVAISLWIIINRFIHGDDNKRVGSLEKESHFTQADANTESSRKRHSLDVKGAITLAVTIASFLLILTYIGNSSSSNVSAYTTQIIVVSLALLSMRSLAIFVIVERRTSSPLIELSLMTHKIFLPANIILLIFGIICLWYIRLHQY
jgi:MFS family permease